MRGWGVSSPPRAVRKRCEDCLSTGYALRPKAGGGGGIAFPRSNAPCPNVSRCLVFPCFVFYPMTMTRIGIVMIDSTVVTKVP